jgi:beta-galactosidase
MALTDAKGQGLLASATESPMQASALPYADEILEPPEYSIDLPPSRATVLVLSAKTLGVGSGSCGPQPLEPYMVWSDPARFSFMITLLPKRVRDLSQVARRAAPPRPLPPLAQPGEPGTIVPWKAEAPGSPALEGLFAWPVSMPDPDPGNEGGT